MKEKIKTNIGSHRYKLLALLAIGILSRLPMLIWNNGYLDGDECVVGLMAKHLLLGTEFPLYFYGQSYGITLLETAAIALFYIFLGITPLAVKLGILLIWLSATLFFYKAMSILDQNKNSWLPFLMTVMFILMPSFSLWSMKARGGYITAFLLSSILLCYLFSFGSHRKVKDAFIVGVLVVLIFQSQALWIIGMIPFISYYFLKEFSAKQKVAHILGISLASLIFLIYNINQSHYWKPAVFKRPDLSKNYLIEIPQFLYRNMTGSYQTGTFLETNMSAKIIAVFYTLIIFISIAFALRRFFPRMKTNLLYGTTATSVLLYILLIPLIDPHTYRYVLPISGFAILMFFILIHNYKTPLLKYIFISLTILGTIAFYQYRYYQFYPTPKNKILQVLESHDVYRAYCEGGLLQWQLMFYSNEKVICRNKDHKNRYQAYVTQVDDAFEDSHTPTALIGYIRYPHLSLPTGAIIIVPGEVFLLFNPSKDILEERGFEF